MQSKSLFPLQALLELRERRVDLRRQELRRVERELHHAQVEAERLRRAHRRKQHELARRPGAFGRCVTTAGELQRCDAMGSALRSEREALRVELCRAENALCERTRSLEAVQERFVRARNELEVVERYQQRWGLRRKQASRRREADQNDDLYAHQHIG